MVQTNRLGWAVEGKRAELPAGWRWQAVAAGLFRKALLALRAPRAFRTARLPDIRAEPPACSGSNPVVAPNHWVVWNRSRQRYARPESMTPAPSYYHLQIEHWPNRRRWAAQLFRWACPAGRL